MFLSLVALSARADAPPAPEAVADPAEVFPDLRPPSPDPQLHLVLLDRRLEDERSARFRGATVPPGETIRSEALLGRLSVPRVLELVPGLVDGRRMDRPVRIVVDGADLASLLD